MEHLHTFSVYYKYIFPSIGPLFQYNFIERTQRFELVKVLGSKR